MLYFPRSLVTTIVLALIALSAILNGHTNPGSHKRHRHLRATDAQTSANEESPNSRDDLFAAVSHFRTFAIDAANAAEDEPVTLAGHTFERPQRPNRKTGPPKFKPTFEPVKGGAIAGFETTF